MCLLCTWLEKADGWQPLSTAPCQRKDPTAPRWGKYNGQCAAKHLGHFLVWQIQLCTSWGSISSAQLGRRGEKLLRGRSSQAQHQLFLAGRWSSPYLSTHGPLPCLFHHHRLVLGGTCDFSALCLSLLLVKEENHSSVSDFASVWASPDGDVTIVKWWPQQGSQGGGWLGFVSWRW